MRIVHLTQSQRQVTAGFYEVRIEGVPLPVVEPPTCASSIAVGVSSLDSDYGVDAGYSTPGDTVTHTTTVTPAEGAPVLLLAAVFGGKNDADDLAYQVPPGYNRLDLSGHNRASFDTAYRVVASPSGPYTASHTYLRNVPWAGVTWAACQFVIPTGASRPIQHVQDVSLPVAATVGNLLLAVIVGETGSPITSPGGDWVELFAYTQDGSTGFHTACAVWGLCVVGGESNYYPFAGTYISLSEWEITGTVTPIVPTHLAFDTQPGAWSTAPGDTIAPALTVRVLDAYDALASDSTASVSIAIGTNPGGGTLSGTLTVAAVDGIATFDDLSIDNAGDGYTLVASSAGLTSATSDAFKVANLNRTALVAPGSSGSGTNILTGAIATGTGDVVVVVQTKSGGNVGLWGGSIGGANYYQSGDLGAHHFTGVTSPYYVYSWPYDAGLTETGYTLEYADWLAQGSPTH